MPQQTKDMEQARDVEVARPYDGATQPAPVASTLRAPWRTEYDDGYAVMDADGDLVAIGMATAEQTRLIAVAPELLAAAKRVLEHLEARIIEAPANAVPVFDGIAELHDAIAKAST
jgi:hypothetical protein